MSASKPNVQAIDSLPHRPPFRFISSVAELERGVRGRGVWEIDGSEDFFAGHFPGEPVVPGVLLAEALAQLAGIVGLAGAGRSARARLAHVDVKFPAGVAPPARVVLNARLIGTLGPLMRFDVEAAAGGATVAIGSITLAAAAREGTRG